MGVFIMYSSTKTYGHEFGLSCAFRQWRAESHCKLIHGYALSVKFVFEADTLDSNNWVVDFGGMKSLKAVLEEHFDHKLLVASDDPMKEDLLCLAEKGVADIIIVDSCGCEKFSEMVYNLTNIWLEDNKYKPRVRLTSVEVREHGANSAVYRSEL